MTKDHKALIERLKMGLLTGHWGKYEEVETILTLARRGLAAEGLVEALQRIQRGDYGKWSDSPTEHEIAEEALEAYTAATQSGPAPSDALSMNFPPDEVLAAYEPSTEPVSTSGPGRATSTPGEAASVAGGQLQDGDPGNPFQRRNLKEQLEALEQKTTEGDAS